MRTPLVAGNWKMNGSSASADKLLTELVSGLPAGPAEVAVCVPYPYLQQAKSMLAGTAVGWGAQNVSQYDKGAYTGEVSTAMLTDFGCRYVIVGHSERRTLFGDMDDVVAAKFCAAQTAGLIPILCVGETLDQREAGTTVAVVERQLMAVIDRAGIEAFESAVLAYEPVWAIGTGRTPTLDEIDEMHNAIRARLVDRFGLSKGESIRILYGGSLKPQNAREILGIGNVNGGLVGGASLLAKDFYTIISAV